MTCHVYLRCNDGARRHAGPWPVHLAHVLVDAHAESDACARRGGAAPRVHLQGHVLRRARRGHAHAPVDGGEARHAVARLRREGTRRASAFNVASSLPGKSSPGQGRQARATRPSNGLPTPQGTLSTHVLEVAPEGVVRVDAVVDGGQHGVGRALGVAAVLLAEQQLQVGDAVLALHLAVGAAHGQALVEVAHLVDVAVEDARGQLGGGVVHCGTRATT